MKSNSMTLLLLTLLVAVLLVFAPAEQTLGQALKLVYFHVTLSYAGLFAFYGAGLLGLVYLIRPKTVIGLWSRELGSAALLVWAVSVLLSLVSMQVVWGGMFWLEPLTIAAITVLFLAGGKELIVRGTGLRFTAIANAVFAAALYIIRNNLERVMHPENPIAHADNLWLKIFPLLLLLVTVAFVSEYTRGRVEKAIHINSKYV